MNDADDRSEYSEDGLYRWWFERRWAEGPLYVPGRAALVPVGSTRHE